MAAIYTDYAVQQFLKEMRDGSGTIPTSYWAALFTTTPNLAGAGGVEVSVGWYSRQPLTYAAPSGRSMANSAAVTFTSSAASAIPSDVVSLGIFDDDGSPSGNLWIILPLTVPLSVGIGSQVIYPIGQIIQEYAS